MLSDGRLQRRRGDAPARPMGAGAVARVTAVRPLRVGGLLMAGTLLALLVASGRTFAQPDVAALPPLEAALAAAPDDLRAGNDYRMAAVAAKQYDRSIAFLEKVVAAHPDSANASLNLGLAYVDKIPVAGAFSQLGLGNRAQKSFTHALELRRTWLAQFLRGYSALFFPSMLGHLKPGIADLEAALALQQADPTPHAYYARTFTSLGDAYFRADQHARAAATWKAGLDAFPAYAPLRTRLGAAPKALDHLIDEAYDADRPIDTSLADMWER